MSSIILYYKVCPLLSSITKYVIYYSLLQSMSSIILYYKVCPLLSSITKYVLYYPLLQSTAYETRTVSRLQDQNCSHGISPCNDNVIKDSAMLLSQQTVKKKLKKYEEEYEVKKEREKETEDPVKRLQVSMQQSG